MLSRMLGQAHLLNALLALAVGASAFPGFGRHSHPDIRAAGGSFAVDALRNPNFQPNGPKEYARALVKWGIDLSASMSDIGSVKGSIGTATAVNQTDDREYLTPMNIGTPPQELLMDFDTGSSDVWVISSETQTPLSATRDRKYWRPEDSSTAEKVNGSRWQITYGDGSYALGNVWRDNVTIANIPVANVTIESATRVSMSMIRNDTLSGLLGLAFQQQTQVYPTETPLIDRLIPLLDQPVFTVDLFYHDVGRYEFGRIDHSRHIHDVHWVPLMEEAEYWEFYVSRVNVANDRVWLLSSWHAIVDTGTTLLLLQSDLVERYYAAVPGAVESEDIGGWVFPCNTKLPDFRLGFREQSDNKEEGPPEGPPGDQRDPPAPPPKNEPWIATIPGKYINYTVAEDNMCYGGIQSSRGSPFSILGDIFLKSVFAVFDRGEGRVGFAHKNLPGVTPPKS